MALVSKRNAKISSCTPFARIVVLKLYKHTEPLRSFPSIGRTPFMPNVTESKNGLKVSDDLRRTPETAPSNPRGSIEPSLRTTVLRKAGTKMDEECSSINLPHAKQTCRHPIRNHSRRCKCRTVIFKRSFVFRKSDLCGLSAQRLLCPQSEQLLIE